MKKVNNCIIFLGIFSLSFPLFSMQRDNMELEKQDENSNVESRIEQKIKARKKQLFEKWLALNKPYVDELVSELGAKTIESVGCTDKSHCLQINMVGFYRVIFIFNFIFLEDGKCLGNITYYDPSCSSRRWIKSESLDESERWDDISSVNLHKEAQHFFLEIKNT